MARYQSPAAEPKGPVSGFESGDRYLLSPQLSELRYLIQSSGRDGHAMTNEAIELLYAQWFGHAFRPCVPNVSSKRKDQQKQ